MTRLDHIRWLGGGTGAGKTTVAARLAGQAGVSIYSSDATIPAHSLKLGAAAAPLLDRFTRMTMDERWVLRDPVDMYETFPWFHGEGFDLLIEDLHELPTDRITIVEGFRLLPDLVGPRLSAPTTGVWLIPTPTFRQEAFARRQRSQAFWRQTTNQQRALDNLLARDLIFTAEVDAAATRIGLPTIAIDADSQPDETVAAVAKQFGL